FIPTDALLVCMIQKEIRSNCGNPNDNAEFVVTMPQPSPLLNLPQARSERWALLSQLVTHWYTPLIQRDGYDAEDLQQCGERLGVPIPAALREWYCLAGRRSDIWNRQDTLLSPERLSFVGDLLEFYVENQYVTSWGVQRRALAEDDPPVLVRAKEKE